MSSGPPARPSLRTQGRAAPGAGRGGEIVAAAVLVDTPGAVTSAPVTTTTAGTVELDLEAHRRELTAYCYRMLESGFEAEDAVQETMVRAWKNLDRFEGRSSLRSWLYRIATNVCLDMLQGPQRRARPIDMGPASPASTP